MLYFRRGLHGEKRKLSCRELRAEDGSPCFHVANSNGWRVGFLCDRGLHFPDPPPFRKQVSLRRYEFARKRGGSTAYKSAKLVSTTFSGQSGAMVCFCNQCIRDFGQCTQNNNLAFHEGRILLNLTLLQSRFLSPSGVLSLRGLGERLRRSRKKKATVSPGEEAWGKQVLEINLLTLPSDKLGTLMKQFLGHKPRGWTKRTIQDRPLFGKGAAKVKGYFYLRP